MYLHANLLTSRRGLSGCLKFFAPEPSLKGLFYKRALAIWEARRYFQQIQRARVFENTCTCIFKDARIAWHFLVALMKSKAETLCLMLKMSKAVCK